jgi:hypothetical protein
VTQATDFAATQRFIVRRTKYRFPPKSHLLSYEEMLMVRILAEEGEQSPDCWW